MGSLLRVLFDGWQLARQPGSPAAMHLLAILENIPSGVQPILAVPEAPAEWFPQVITHVQETLPQNRFAWEQSSLPRLARRLDARFLHLFSASAPLLGRSLVVVSPCDLEPAGLFDPAPAGKQLSLQGRLRNSVQLGGLARAQAIFWPDDLNLDRQADAFQWLPPVVYSGFSADTPLENTKLGNGSARAWEELHRLDLPDTYLLYHGPASAPAINRVCAAWRWAAGPIGDYHPLLILGFNAAERDHLEKITDSLHFGGTVKALPELSPQAVALLYQGCTALFHPVPEPVWGGPIRHALACGKPIIASQEAQTSHLVGPAAYLAAGDDGRSLGAALITVVVEEEVAGKLALAARQRASTWTGVAYSQALSAAYQRILAERSKEF
jgi:hypothetical protein